MKRGRSLIFTLLLVLVILAGTLAAVYAYTLTKISVESAQVDGVNNLTAEGFTLLATINIKNDGILPITIKEVTYEIIVNDNETIDSGSLPGAALGADMTTPYRAAIPVKWQPTAQLAAKLFVEGDVEAKIRGEIVLSEFGILEVKIPYETSFNLKDYVMQFVPTDAQGIISAVFGFVENNQDGIFGAARNFINR